MRNVMLVAVFGVYLPLWYFTQDWGNHGLWFAMLAFLAARGVFMAIYYWRILQWFFILNDHRLKAVDSECRLKVERETGNLLI